MIDLDALFTGAGSGEYVGAMLKNDIIPPPSFHLYPLGMDGSSVVYANELDTLPIILQLDFEVTVLGVRLALLAQEFRQDTTFGKNGSQQRDRETRLRQTEATMDRAYGPDDRAVSRHAAHTIETTVRTCCDALPSLHHLFAHFNVVNSTAGHFARLRHRNCSCI